MDYKELNIKLTEGRLEDLERDGLDKGTNDRLKRVSEVIEKHCKKEGWTFEMGARRGDLLDKLKWRGFKFLSGADISEKAIDILKSKGYIGRVMDMMNMVVLKDNTYDTVIMSHTLEHCPFPDNPVHHVHRILRKDGIFYVEVPKQVKEPVPTKWGHCYCFDSHEDLASFFDSDKWELLYHEDNNPLISVYKKK